jgi:hypothetical protein
VATVLCAVIGVSTARAGDLVLSSCAGASGFSDFEFPDNGAWVFGETADATSFQSNVSCNSGRSFKIVAARSAAFTQYGQWSTSSPGQIVMTGAWTPANTMLVNPKAYTNGYDVRFAYAGGSGQITAKSNCCGGMDYASQINKPFSGHWFGIQVTCNGTIGCAEPTDNADLIDIPAIEISAVDDTAPTITPVGSANLAAETRGWVRGSWPMDIQAAAEDAVCHVWAIVDGQPIQGPSITRDDHAWMQCDDPLSWQQTIDTASYANGPLSLELGASDAATPANVSSPSETVDVDNQPVELNLSGPTNMPITAGPPYVTASATAGPSGVGGISCSVDGSIYVWHPGSSVRIPVVGLGTNTVACYAENNAINASGNPARSATETWTVKIGQPTVMGIAFMRIVDRLHCTRVRERVRVPARWVTVRVHNRVVRVRTPATVEVVKVTRCHPRLVRKRVAVWEPIIRNGKRTRVKRRKVIRVAVPPHVADYTAQAVPWGRRTTVSGWLGTAGGTALAGQRVSVFIAPNNGRYRFRLAREVKTASNGSWSARLPAGPSRLVKAVFAGGATTEPAVSQQVHIVTRAVVRLHIHPRAVPWHGTIVITGRVLGGQIPGKRQHLLRLRIGADGIFSTVGIPDVTRAGRFRTTWTFHTGVGVVHYWFAVSTLNEADYAFYPGSSPRVSVIVGPG